MPHPSSLLVARYVGSGNTLVAAWLAERSSQDMFVPLVCSDLWSFLYVRVPFLCLKWITKSVLAEPCFVFPLLRFFLGCRYFNVADSLAPDVWLEPHKVGLIGSAKSSAAVSHHEKQICVWGCFFLFLEPWFPDTGKVLVHNCCCCSHINS